MKCVNHQRVEATAICAECGRDFCGPCTVVLDEKPWCRECLSAIVGRSGKGGRQSSGWTWRKIAAALLSIIPGAGHMFLGLIGKGFTLMGLLMASVFLVILYSDATGMYWMTAYLVPALSLLFLSYAVFDVMAISDAQRSGRTATPSEDEMMKTVWERVLLNRFTLGWIILVAGAVGVLRLFAEPFSRWTMERFSVSFSLSALLIPVILLVLGILLLQRSRKGR